MDLKGKTVLITGASRGIGKSITESSLKAGASVIGSARSSEFPELFNSDAQFEGVHVDLADPDQLQDFFISIFNRQKKPDVLVNNAGIFMEADMTQNDEKWLKTWHRTLQVNLHAPALLCKWAINSWVKDACPGIIINIASRAAYRGDTQEYAAYAASKGGLVSFTKSIARDFGKNNIIAYSIAPGFIKTDMAMESVEVYGEDYLTEGMAFDEITDPGQVGDLVAFLASGKVPHMTGSTFHINGGSYMI